MQYKLLLGLAALLACGGENAWSLRLPLAGGDGGTVLIGSPCVSDLENEATFDGFSRSEVSVQSFAGQPAGAPVCLVLGFQGRISCPYGQDVTGAGPHGTACKTPMGAPVTVAVAPQCVDRRPADHVVWSCRCADPSGQSSTVCRCPSGMVCLTGVVQPAGPEASNGNLDGAYCVPSGAVGNSETCSATCDPGAHPCD